MSSEATTKTTKKAATEITKITKAVGRPAQQAEPWTHAGGSEPRAN